MTSKVEYAGLLSNYRHPFKRWWLVSNGRNIILSIVYQQYI